MESTENSKEPAGTGNKKLLVELIPFIIFIFLNGSSGYAFFGFAPDLLEGLGISEGYISLILLSQPITIMLFSSVFGRLSDKKRTRKKLMAFGLLVKVTNYTMFHVFIFTGVTSIFAYLTNYLIRGLSIALSSCEATWFSDFTLEMNGDLAGSKKSKHSGISYYFLVTSISWASGTVIIGGLIGLLGLENLGILVLVVASAGFIPLAFIKEKYALSCKEPPAVSFNLKQDLKDLDQGKLIYPALAFRHFGVITSLSLVAIVSDDLGLEEGATGVIISLNPVFQIAGMVIASLLLSRQKIKPLKMFSSGLLISAFVISMYTFAVAAGNGVFLIIGQSSLGFAWPLLIVGFDEYIINRVPWTKRANYVSMRITFMNFGKILGQFSYFILFEFLSMSRLSLFTMLIFFPFAGFLLALVAINNQKKVAQA